MIHATPVRPQRMERESQQRLETTITSSHLDLADPNVVAYFAVAGWNERPSSWHGGQWRVDGVTHVAESPITNQGQFLFPPGVHFVFLKVTDGVESNVVDLGRVTVK